MHIISHWQQLPSLPLPEHVMSLLKRELSLPFEHDETAIAVFWESPGVTLIHIEAGDAPEIIEVSLMNIIQRVTENPEFVIRLTEDYYLLLSVTGDDGAGVYLLFHPDCPLDGITKLITMAETQF
ncbi:hypothetical protein OZ696_001943 [Yersinia enterocolitica]